MATTLPTSDGLSLAHRATFAAATAVLGYYSYRQMKPPRPLNLKESKEALANSPLRHTFKFLALYRAGILGLSGLQAITALYGPPYTQLFGQHASPEIQVNPLFLTWNRTSAWVVPLTALAAYLRVRAFEELGKNFTFDLHDPDRLITSGLYSYVQHPSYTTAYFAMIGSTWWFTRADGIAGALLPPRVYGLVEKYQWLWHSFVAVGMVAGLWKRVRNEENMLRAKFGAEWEEWHQKTPRFVPFLF